MKIDVRQIPLGGLDLKEDLPASGLDLETEIVKFSGPVKARARVSRITNAVTVELSLSGTIRMICGRCLNEFETGFKKDLVLNYPVDNTGTIIDLDPDIREEIIFDYPIKPLCQPGCNGLCLKCGKDLNQGVCGCN